MPGTQVATIGTYDFGAPATEAVVLSFRTKKDQGGKLELLFTNDDGAATGTVTVQVSANGSSYSDTTAAANLTAVADKAIAPKITMAYTVLLRRGTDLYMRVQAVGGCRMGLQIRGDDILEPITI